MQQTTINKLKFNLFFMLCGLMINIHAQTKNINGSIIIDVESFSPEDVFVTNLRSKQIAITDVIGHFNIKANVNDTLLVESSIYETRKIVLTKNLLQKEKIIIHLNINPITLQEAIISPKLTGYLEKDINLVKTDHTLTKLYKSLGVNPDIEPRRDASPIQLGKDIGITHLDIGRLYDFFSGNLRRRQALFEYEDREKVITNIRAYFGDKYYTTELNIPQEKIREFIVYTYKSSKLPFYYKQKNYFKMLEAFSFSSKIYTARIYSQSKN